MVGQGVHINLSSDDRVHQVFEWNVNHKIHPVEKGKVVFGFNTTLNKFQE
jgi:hypothetical protein